MTVAVWAQLRDLSCIFSLLRLLSGKLKISSFPILAAFGGDKVEDVCNALIEKGFNYAGKEFVTSGITG